MPRSLFDQVTPKATPSYRNESVNEVARKSVERVERRLDAVFNKAKPSKQ